MAQEYGKLFTSVEADENFGPVISSTTLSINTLNELLNQTDGYIMFKIVSDDLIVLDNNRVSIHPLDYPVQEQSVFTVYNISIVNQLLSQEVVTEVSVEQRAEVLSITCGNLTLEMGSPCPPYCISDLE